MRASGAEKVCCANKTFLKKRRKQHKKSFCKSALQKQTKKNQRADLLVSK